MNYRAFAASVTPKNQRRAFACRLCGKRLVRCMTDRYFDVHKKCAEASAKGGAR